MIFNLFFIFLSFFNLSYSTTPEGLLFLSSNKNEPNVVTLPSGLQYKIIKSGPEGALSPRVDSPCECHYRGRFIYFFSLLYSFIYFPFLSFFLS